MLFGLFGNNGNEVKNAPANFVSVFKRCEIAKNVLKILSKNCSLDKNVLNDNKEFIEECAGLKDITLNGSFIEGTQANDPIVSLSETSKFLITRDEKTLRIYVESRKKNSVKQEEKSTESKEKEKVTDNESNQKQATVEEVKKYFEKLTGVEKFDLIHKAIHDTRVMNLITKYFSADIAKKWSDGNIESIEEDFNKLHSSIDFAKIIKSLSNDNNIKQLLKDYVPENMVDVILKMLSDELTQDIVKTTDLIDAEFVDKKETNETKTDSSDNNKTEDESKQDNVKTETTSDKPEETVKSTEVKSEPTESMTEVVKTEEKPETKQPVGPTLKTGEELEEEKLIIAEIVHGDNKSTDEKIKEAVQEGVEKGDIKIKAVTEPATPEAETLSKPVVTYADLIKDGFSKFESSIFDKLIKKYESAASDGKLTFDIKLTKVLVKRCDKENKIVTFVFVNDNKQYPLLETFYYTGNNKQSTIPFTDVNSFIKAHKERNEAAKKDEKLKPKCYNIKYSTIPGYVAPAK